MNTKFPKLKIAALLLLAASAVFAEGEWAGKWKFIPDGGQSTFEQTYNGGGTYNYLYTGGFTGSGTVSSEGPAKINYDAKNEERDRWEM